MTWRSFALIVAGAFIGGAGGGWLASRAYRAESALPVMPRRTADLPRSARPKPLELVPDLPPWPISSPRVLP